MKTALASVTFCLVVLTGCTPASRSPDAVREDAAHATAMLKRNVKAAAEGVKQGWKQEGPVNINKASKAEIESLPGISGEVADRIIANRPYVSATELRTKRLVTKDEYNKIAEKITAK